MGKVGYSQSVTSKKPLTPWFIAEKTGSILTAHCDCMAGLGECCSRVGALLFAVDAASTLEKNKPVTQEPAYRLLPSGVSKVPYEPVSQIDFTSANLRKRKIEIHLICRQKITQ